MKSNPCLHSWEKLLVNILMKCLLFIIFLEDYASKTDFSSSDIIKVACVSQ